MDFVNGSILHRVWTFYVALFGGNRRVSVLAAVPMVVAVAGIVVRGFQYDTWAWTEHYSDAYYYLEFAKQAAQGEFFTYANVFPSSGIHPLHWLHLAAVYALTGGSQAWMFPILFATYALAFTITTWAGAVHAAGTRCGGQVNLSDVSKSGTVFGRPAKHLLTSWRTAHRHLASLGFRLLLAR